MIPDLENINTSTKEGRLLMAALTKITTESQTDKTPYEVLEQLDELANNMGLSSNAKEQFGTPKLNKTLSEVEFKELFKQFLIEEAYGACDVPLHVQQYGVTFKERASDEEIEFRMNKFFDKLKYGNASKISDSEYKKLMKALYLKNNKNK